MSKNVFIFPHTSLMIWLGIEFQVEIIFFRNFKAFGRFAVSPRLLEKAASLAWSAACEAVCVMVKGTGIGTRLPDFPPWLRCCLLAARPQCPYLWNSGGDTYSWAVVRMTLFNSAVAWKSPWHTVWLPGLMLMFLGAYNFILSVLTFHLNVTHSTRYQVFPTWSVIAGHLRCPSVGLSTYTRLNTQHSILFEEVPSSRGICYIFFG